VSDILERLKTALADRYVIERELGAGGMATVYLAQDVRHSRQVALKVLRPDLSAVLGADRFLQEIRPGCSIPTSCRSMTLGWPTDCSSMSCRSCAASRCGPG
jgi:hypothetical protein